VVAAGSTCGGGDPASGEPLAYLTGRQRFAGVELLAAPGALIPRVETELLARTALEKLRSMPMVAGGRRALDLCTVTS
jgi:release factor glutamine methyltransferase